MAFEDDEFYFDDSDTTDVQMTAMEQAQYNIFDIMGKTIDDIKMNLKLKEQSDAQSNMSLLAKYFDSALKIQEAMAKSEQLSDEEIAEVLDEINRQTTELTYSNIDDIVINENEEQEKAQTTDFGDDDDDSSLDF